jgi:hypothetical protein
MGFGAQVRIWTQMFPMGGEINCMRPAYYRPRPPTPNGEPISKRDPPNAAEPISGEQY